MLTCHLTLYSNISKFSTLFIYGDIPFNSFSAGCIYICARAPFPSPRDAYICSAYVACASASSFSLAPSHRLSTGLLDFRHVREMFRSQSPFQRQHGYASSALQLLIIAAAPPTNYVADLAIARAPPSFVPRYRDIHLRAQWLASYCH